MKENSINFKLKLRKWHLRNDESIYGWCSIYNVMVKELSLALTFLMWSANIISYF